jgi:transposase
MGYWAEPRVRREQALLFPPRLDDAIDEQHPARLLDEVLLGLDWSAWEAEYDGTHGQPPIHPRVMAGVLLYGMMRGVRSSRQLEYFCGHNIDYIWLAEGRIIDHSTFCTFRTRFREPLKGTFKQIGKLALDMGLVRLVEVAFDGTRVRANAGRFQTWTAAKVEAALKELEVLFDQAMEETARADASGQGPAAAPDTPSLPPELATAKARQAKLKELQAKLHEADETRRKAGIDPQKNPAQVPKADNDATVMPNKEGGYAPNYTPLAAVDTHSDWIVDCDVTPGPQEQEHTLAVIDRIEETFGQKPERAMADALHATGENLAGMEARQVEFYSPVESPVPGEGNPARRDDPRRPVPESERDKLPLNDQKRLAKCCFIYNEAEDCYSCPMGQVLHYKETKKDERGGAVVPLRIYRCDRCEGCPLASVCRDPRAKRGRSISRDGYEPHRERMHQRMSGAEGKATYARRFHAAESPFAYIKCVMGVRRFLLRGLPKVRTEWLWVCTAYNMRRLLTAIGQLRAALANAMAETVS